MKKNRNNLYINMNKEKKTRNNKYNKIKNKINNNSKKKK